MGLKGMSMLAKFETALPFHIADTLQIWPCSHFSTTLRKVCS